MIAIGITGNYTFFNLLTIVVLLAHYDDEFINAIRYKQFKHSSSLKAIIYHVIPIALFVAGTYFVFFHYLGIDNLRAGKLPFNVGHLKGLLQKSGITRWFTRWVCLSFAFVFMICLR